MVSKHPASRRCSSLIPRLPIAAVVLGAWLCAGAGGTASPRPTMALTFDDLPYATGMGEGTGALADAARVTTALLETLAAHDAPAVGFVIAGRLGDDAERAARERLLAQWVDADAALGNHTYAHTDFNKVSVEEFEHEIETADAVVRRLMRGRDASRLYFRHPQTHTGDTPEKKAAIEVFLEARGYVVAPHTIDSEDFLFNAAFVRARRDGDTGTAARLADAYVRFVLAATSFAEGMAPKIFGRPIPQVILLHANDLNADVLDRLLRALERRGYAFVTLDTVMADPAYGTRDTFVTTFGPTWLWRWTKSLGLALSFAGDPEPPAWITAGREEADVGRQDSRK